MVRDADLLEVEETLFSDVICLLRATADILPRPRPPLLPPAATSNCSSGSTFPDATLPRKYLAEETKTFPNSGPANDFDHVAI